MTRNELLQYLQKYEKQHQRNRRKRCFRTVLFYTVVLFLMLYCLDLLGDNMGDILCGAAFCFIASFFSYFINLEIFSRLLEADKEEEQGLDFFRKRLKDKEQDNHP